MENNIMENNENVGSVDNGISGITQEAQEQGQERTEQETVNPASSPVEGQDGLSLLGSRMVQDYMKPEKEVQEVKKPQDDLISRLFREKEQGDRQAERAMTFLTRIGSRNYKEDEEMLRDECYSLERDLYGFTAGDRGSQWNRGVPFETAKQHAQVLEGIIRNGYSSIAPEGFDEWYSAKQTGASRDELAKLAGVSTTEWVNRGGGMGYNTDVQQVRRNDADIDADLAKYDAKMWANNFMNVYKRMRPDMDENAVSIVDKAIKDGNGLDKADVGKFLALGEDDRAKAAKLIDMSRANVPAFWKDLGGSTFDLARQMAEGTAMFVQDAMLPSNVMNKLIDEGRARINAGLEPLTDEERELIKGEQDGSAGFASARITLNGPVGGGIVRGPATTYSAVDMIAMRHAKSSINAALLVERKARDDMRMDDLQVRMLTERKPYDDYNFAQEAIIGAVTTLPYMAEAAIPVAGIGLVAMQQFENVKDQLIQEGYSPSTMSDEATLVQFGLACAWAATERIQAEGILGKPLTALQYRTLMKTTAKTAFGKVKEIGGKLTKETLAETIFESVQEGLQGGIEKGTIAGLKEQDWKDVFRKDNTVKAVCDGIAGDFVDSLGTMGIISLFGTGRKFNRARTANFDAESVQDFASRQMQITSAIRDTQPTVTDPSVTPKLAARREKRANELVQKAAEIWRKSEDRADARNQIEDLFGLDENSTRMLCEWLADRDTVIENLGRGQFVADELKAAYGTDNVMEALYRHGTEGHWDVIENFFKEHYLARGMSEEEAAKQAKYQVGLEQDMAKKGINYRSPDGVFSKTELLDPVAFMRTFINPDLNVEDAEAVVDGKKMKGSAIVIPVKKQDGTTENFRLFSIVRPEGKIDINADSYATDVENLHQVLWDKDRKPVIKNGEATVITKDVWKKLSTKQKNEQIARHGWKVQGGFRFVSPNGKDSVSVNGIMSLFNKDGKYTAKTQNRDVAHEVAHAVVRFAREAGAIGNVEADVMRQLFGEAINEGELWNEEAMADSFRDYLQGQFDFGKFKPEYRGIVEKAFDAVRQFIVNMLRTVGVDVGVNEQERRNAYDAVWEGIKSGDFSKLRQYANLRFAEEGGELQKEQVAEADKEEADDTRLSMRMSPSFRNDCAKVDGEKPTFAMYVRATKVGYAKKLADGTKVMETRTPAAVVQLIAKGLKVGDRVSFIETESGEVSGYATLSEITEPMDAAKFHSEEVQKMHGVPVGDKYDIQEGKTKVGLVFTDAKESNGGVKNRMTGDRQGYRYSLVTNEQESAYQEALLDGDDERAVEILRNVANGAMPDTKVVDENGLPKIVYHRTENTFTKFDLGKSRKSMDIQGFFFYDDPNAGEEYGRIKYGCFLNITNPYVVDSVEKMNALNFDLSKENDGIRVRNELMSKGYDGIVRTKEFMGDSADEWIAFKPEQIKLAEPTYKDEYGEQMIPLNERFNPNTDDIRYSLNAKPTENIDFEGAKKFYGVTDNIEDAYFILPDGSLLDLSQGGHDAEYNDPEYGAEHVDVGVFLGLGYQDKPVEKFLNGGAIRIRLDANPIIDLRVVPTPEQVDKIYDYIEKAKELAEDNHSLINLECGEYEWEEITPEQAVSILSRIRNKEVRYSLSGRPSLKSLRHQELYERYRNGDESALDEAKQLVREAAAKAGYSIPLWRVFKEGDNRTSYSNVRDGVYYATDLGYYDKSDTGYKASDAKPFFLNSNANVWNPIEEFGLQAQTWSRIDAPIEFLNKYGVEDEQDWEGPEDWGATSTVGLAMAGNRLGYDATLLKGIPTDSGYGRGYDEYAIYNSNIVKSADPFTFDDAGNLIPLDERFNKQDDDIRYTIRSKDITDEVGTLKVASNIGESADIVSHPDVVGQPERLSLVTDKKTLDRLNSAEYITVYRAAIRNGDSVYSPKATRINGKMNGQRIGEWYKSDEFPELVRKDGKFKLDGAGLGSDIWAAYAPYFHTRVVMNNSQFSAAWKRPDITVFECRIPKFEFEGETYQAKGSEKRVGLWDWSRTKLADDNTTNAAKVYLSQYMKVVREVPVDEIAANIKSEIGDGEIAWNTVSAPLRRELRSIGANVTDRIKGLSGKALEEAKEAQYEESHYLELHPQAKQNVALANELENDGAGDFGKDGEVRLTLTQYNRIGKQKLEDWLNNPSNNVSPQERDRILTGLDGMAKLMESMRGKYGRFSAWSDADVEYDPKTGKPYFKVVVQNAEYTMNFDFSTVCVRRRPLDGLLNALAKEKGGILEQTPLLTRAMIADIQENVIKKHGFDVACPLCFVDTKRYTVDYFARRFAETFNRLLGEFNAKKVSELGKRWAFRVKEVQEKEKRNENRRSLDAKRDAELEKYVAKRQKAGETKKAITSSSSFKEHKKALKEKYKHDKIEAFSNEEQMIQLIMNSPDERIKVLSQELISSWGQDTVVKNRIGLFGIWRQTGAGRPKDSVADHSWNNDIIDPVRDVVTDEAVNFDPKLAFAIGGVRIQSFSDYVPTMVFDYMQMIAELSAKGLPMHTYTKEENFIKIFGHTGIKMNMSLVPAVAVNPETHERIIGKDGKTIPAGLDAAGNYLWSDECFPPELAFKYRDGRFGGNVGTIAVGVSNEHIIKLLRDEMIDQVIPYHASGINPEIARLRNIAGYEDYTDTQHETYSAWKMDANGNDVLDDRGNKIPSKWADELRGIQYAKDSSCPKIADFFNWYGELSKANDAGDKDAPRTVAKKYREWCYANDIVPKFNQFRNEVNYYKLLTDFRMYDEDGNYAPQKAVEFNFGGDENNTCGKDVLKAIHESLKTYDDEQDKYDKTLPQMLKEAKEVIRSRMAEAEQEWVEENAKVNEKLDIANAKRQANSANNERLTIIQRNDGVNAADYARAFVASTLMQGRGVTEQDVGKLLKGLRLPDDNAALVLQEAQTMAKEKAMNVGETIQANDPTLLNDLAKTAMKERFNRAMVSALMGGAKAADPVIGENLEKMRQRQLNRALDEAHGFTQAEMRSELYVNLSAALFKVADFEKTPEQLAKLAAWKKEQEEKKARGEQTDEEDVLKLFDEEGNLKEIAEPSHERKEVPESVRKLLDEIMAGADKREERRKRREAKKAEAKKAREDAAKAAGENAETKAEDNTGADDVNFGEETIDEETFDLLKPVFSSADQFASFVEEWVFRKLKEKNPKLQGASVFRDPVNLRELQNTAKDILHNLAKDTLGKTPAYVVAERQIDAVMNYKYLTHVHNHVAYVYGRIHENALRINRNKLVTELVTEMKKKTGARGRFKNTEEEKNRKVFSKTELWVRKLIPLLTMSEEKLNAKRQELDDTLARYNTSTAEGKWEADNDLKYQEASLEYSLLQQYGGMKRWMVGDIIDASNEILRALDGNIQEFLMRQEERREANRAVRQALIDAMEEGYKNVGKSKLNSTLNKLLRFPDAEMGNIELRLKDLLKYCRDEQKKAAALKAIEELMFQLGRGSEKFNMTIGKGRKEINEMLARCYGSAEAGIKHLQDELPQSVKVGRKTFNPEVEIFQQGGHEYHTFGNLLQLYGSCLQVDYHDNVITHGRDKQLYKMFATLTPQDRMFHKELVMWYKQNRLELSNAVEAITGLPVRSPDEKYIPVKPLNEPNGFKANVQAWNPITASMTARIRHGLDFDENADILLMVDKAIQDRAQIIGYGQTGIFLRDTIAHHDVQVAGRQFADKGQMGKIIDQITDTLTQARPDSGKASPTQAFLRQYLSLAYLSWNVVSGSKQLGSFSVWGNTVGLRKVGKYMVNVDMDAVRELMQTEGYKARYMMGWTPETQELLRDPNPNRLKALWEKGMCTSRFFDQLCCLWMAQGCYRDLKQKFMTELNEDGTRLYTDDEAKERAATITWNWCEEGQQTGRKEFLNEKQRKNSLASFFYQFMTAPLLQLNYELAALRKVAMTGGKDGKKELARAVLINHVIVPAVFELISVAFQALGLSWRPDDDEEWMESVKKDFFYNMALGSYAPMWVLVGITEGIWAAATEGNMKEVQALPSSSAVKHVFDVSRLVIRSAKYGMTELGVADFADITADDCLKDLNRFFRNSFAPYKQIDNAVKRWTGKRLIGE